MTGEIPRLRLGMTEKPACSSDWVTMTRSFRAVRDLTTSSSTVIPSAARDLSTSAQVSAISHQDVRIRRRTDA
jgi:hypothetical protein